MKQLIEDLATITGVMLTESSKMAVWLMGVLMAVSVGAGVLSAVYGSTQGLKLAVEGAFLMYGYGMVFVVAYLALRKTTATVASTNYKTAKRRVP